MSNSLYASLKGGLGELAHSLETHRQASFAPVTGSSALPPIAPADLTDQVRNVWTSCESDQGSSRARRVEVVKSVLDLVGRDLVVTPVYNGDVSAKH